jgi:hypothetical protein
VTLRAGDSDFVHEVAGYVEHARIFKKNDDNPENLYRNDVNEDRYRKYEILSTRLRQKEERNTDHRASELKDGKVPVLHSMPAMQTSTACHFYCLREPSVHLNEFCSSVLHVPSPMVSSQSDWSAGPGLLVSVSSTIG